MKYSITDVLVCCGIAFIVVCIWQMLEIGIEGEIVESHVDSTIAIILTYSLYGNYCSYIKR